MWYKMANCIKRVAKDVFGESQVKKTNSKKRVGGGTNQDVCRPTQPKTLSSRPISFFYLGGIPRLKRSNSSREHTKQRYELGK